MVCRTRDTKNTVIDVNKDFTNKILGPVMIPDKKMLRYHGEIGFYELEFSTEKIEFYRSKFHLEKKDNNLNIQHDQVINEGVKLTDSFLINEESRKSLPLDFQSLPNGTWMMEYTFDSP
jgi:hypothetical protein